MLGASQCAQFDGGHSPPYLAARICAVSPSPSSSPIKGEETCASFLSPKIGGQRGLTSPNKKSPLECSIRPILV